MVHTHSSSRNLRTTHITYTSDNEEAAADFQACTATHMRTDITYTTAEPTSLRRKVINSSELNGCATSGSLRTHPTVYIVFVSLLLDLLAFTMILPLLPSLLDHYSIHDSPNGLYPWLLGKVRYFQELVGAPDKFNSVLFGGK